MPIGYCNNYKTHKIVVLKQTRSNIQSRPRVSKVRVIFLCTFPYGLPTKYGWAVEKWWIFSIVHYSKINYSNNKLYA